MGSNPTASAIAVRASVLCVALLLGGCTGVPGETLTDGARQRAVRSKVLDMSREANAGCRQHNVTNTEVVELHGDGKVAAERWTVTQCGRRVPYLVTFPPTGRGTGFLVRASK